MARETKIGLLVGLGVIIFIGILISEQLSGPGEHAHLAPDDDPAAYVNATPRGTGSPDGAQRRDPVRLPEAFRETTAEAQRPAERPTGGDAGTPAPEPTIWRMEYPTPAYEVSADRGPTPPRPAGASDSPTDLARERPDLFEDRGTERVVRLTADGARPDRREADNRSEPPADHLVHHVQRNESLYRIAQQYYGDGNYWRTIYEANRHAIPDPDRLRAGVRLMIPDKAGQADGSGSAQRSQAPRPAASDPAPEYQTYTVQTGDSLSRIASRFYGSGEHWPKLYELNKSRIPNPDVLTVGTELRVPVR